MIIQSMYAYSVLTDKTVIQNFILQNFQGALHSFLPPDEKKILIDQLREAYGIVSYNLPSSGSPSATRTPTPPPKPSVTFGTWAERA